MVTKTGGMMNLSSLLNFDLATILTLVFGLLAGGFFGWGKVKSAQAKKAQAQTELEKKKVELHKQNAERAEQAIKKQNEVNHAKAEIDSLSDDDVAKRLQQYDRARSDR